MGTGDLPNMYALSPRVWGPRALGIHIRQITCAHVATITYALFMYVCIYVHFVDPIAPPQNVTVVVINSTSISVSWNPPPLRDQNGDIIGYQLMIINHNRSNSSISVVNVSNVTTYVAINLQEFEVYSFEIAAITTIGLGTFSVAITDQTFEDGK